MTVEITPAPLCGKVAIPPSKSAAHRCILGAALATGTSRVAPACHSNDIDATLSAAVALGATVQERADAFYITGIGGRPQSSSPITVDCGESGSTLRFLLPIAAALGRTVTFTGHGRLPQRPMREMTELLRQNGVQCSSDLLPITVTGRLKPGVFKISGAVSSQHLTGLLLALPLVQGGSRAELTTSLQSAGYIALTRQVLAPFGITVTEQNGCYQTSGCYRAANVQIEGDWSQASFYLAAAAMGAKLQLTGLNRQSAQGDRAGVAVFQNLGVCAEWQGPVLNLEPALSTQKATPAALEIDCRNIPDMVPAIAAAAMFAKGKTVLTHAERLRFKESDRLATTADAINALGGRAEQTADGLVIYPAVPQGGQVCGANDHRIVMAFSMAAAYAAGKTCITHAEAVQKSYPGFFGDFNQLGGVTHVFNLRNEASHHHFR